MTLLRDQGLEDSLTKLDPNTGVLQRPRYGADITLDHDAMLTPDQLDALRRFENGGEFDSDAEFDEALKRLTSSEELHYLVQALNWDDEKTSDAIRWVIDHPACDLGTALYIYWLNEPSVWKKAEAANDIPAWGRRDYELHKDLEARLLAGRFNNRTIAFDPRKERYIASSEAAESPEERAIPAELKKASLGKSLPDYYDLD